MKVLEKSSSVLSNWEVLNIVREQKGEYDGTDGTGRARPMPANLSRVLNDVETQLTAAGSPLSDPHGRYSSAAFRELFTRTKDAGFSIEKAELLMILNLRPKSLAELDTIMEELDSRYGEEKQEELLAIVKECLGPVEEGGMAVDVESEATDAKHDRHRFGGAEVDLAGQRVQA
ncbi:RNA polymerase Rpb4-domain-containing protein [Phyllosticta capitalensis]|uniref:DNA-directed RNA polymerase III subunit RPC9 n=1 Tax=Phyllosticta capitalensis TaxID=121624 RepID=A0ABR1YM23_9PEZI